MSFRFEHPEAFILVGLIGVLFWLQARRYRLQSLQLSYSDASLISQLPLSWRYTLRHIPNVLLGLALLGLVVVIARPQSGQTSELIRYEGIEIVLALDISRSMDAVDMEAQSRLEVAKSVIAQFIQGRQHDRIGLVVFSSRAYQLVPPTTDYRTLLGTLSRVQLANTLGLPDGTAIGVGLAGAANMLLNNAIPSRVIILLTDGANTAGRISPITAAQATSAVGIRIYTIGVGATTADNSVLMDSKGEPFLVIEGLDEETLQSIATIGEGAYFSAQSLTDLQAVYDQINALEQTPFTRLVQINWQDEPEGLLILIVILLGLERWFKRVVLWSAL